MFTSSNQRGPWVVWTSLVFNFIRLAVCSSDSNFTIKGVPQEEGEWVGDETTHTLGHSIARKFTSHRRASLGYSICRQVGLDQTLVCYRDTVCAVWGAFPSVHICVYLCRACIGYYTNILQTTCQHWMYIDHQSRLGRSVYEGIMHFLSLPIWCSWNSKAWVATVPNAVSAYFSFLGSCIMSPELSQKNLFTRQYK